MSVGCDGVFVLTQLPPETQVFEETEEELPPFLVANKGIVLGLLLLQGLSQRNRGRLELGRYQMESS